MTFELWWSDKIAKGKVPEFKSFCQKMANRLIQGEARYGSGDERQKYMSRLIVESKAYKRTGNKEHLYNIANYCILESMFPENKKHHLNTLVDSATRNKFGGSI